MRRALESNGPADSLDCYLRRLRRNGNRVVRYVEAARSEERRVGKECM